MKTNIAVLLTCHNRKEKTLQCLQSLFKADLPPEYSIKIFLVDDGSTDGTGKAVKENYPQINVINGNGNLFWNQGMRMAWKTAAETEDFHFYFWLNDDTILDRFSLIEMLADYRQAEQRDGKPVIVAGTCRAENETLQFSYGGRNDNGPLIPNGELQTCTYINGNAVLVPNEIFFRLGNLSNDYTHGMGDNDYGLRAILNGYTCYTTRKFVATCPPNEGVPGWCSPDVSLKKRWQLLHSPLGLNIKEYVKYRRKFWGVKWVGYAFKGYARVLFPRLYQKIK